MTRSGRYLLPWEMMSAPPDAPVAVRQSMQTLLDRFKVKDVHIWRAMTLDQQRQFKRRE